MNTRMNTDMKLILLGLICVVVTQANVKAQTPLQDMVKTEQAFSKMAEEKNTRDAFLAFIADDGLLFRPGAVNGKKWLLEHPAQASDKRPLLAWQPSFAGMAASGDLGFTTGPWELKSDIKDEKPAGYGHFMTIWKKQPDGSWKFVVDLGISHPQSGGPQTLWQPAEVNPKTSDQMVDQKSQLKVLLARDPNFGSVGLNEGLVKAFRLFASPDVRLYRNGSLPFIGRDASAEALATVKGKFYWRPLGGDVSRGGDLGYTHGTYEVEDMGKVIEHGSYVRIWKKEDGVWRIVMDVIHVHEK
jgi:ketosteroid isomerase-like protein